MFTVYRIDFPDGKVYFGYTAKPLAVRLEAHIESSQVGKSPLYKAIRMCDYECVGREVNKFHTMEEALDWEKKLIKKTSKEKRLNVSWGGENGENNKRRWAQQDIIKKHYKKKNRKEKYKYD